MKIRQLLPVAAMIAVLGVTAGVAQADHMGRMAPQGGMQGGHMMGQGGMGWGDCPGGGMIGPGMMGGEMMGPGMMSGGMMMGPGMMGGVYGELDLSKEQRDQIAKIRSETRRKHWELMGKMHDEQDKLAAQLAADTPDSAAIGKQYQRIQELQRQMLESSIDARNRMQAVLTEEQKGKLRELRRHYGMWG